MSNNLYKPFIYYIMTEQLEGDIKMKELDLESFYKEYGIPVNYQFRHNTVSYLIIAVLKKYSTTFTINDKLDLIIKKECQESGILVPRKISDIKRDIIPQEGLTITIKEFVQKYNFFQNIDNYWLFYLYNNHLRSKNKNIFITPSIHQQICDDLETKEKKKRLTLQNHGLKFQEG